MYNYSSTFQKCPSIRNYCKKNLAGAENMYFRCAKFHACELCGFCIKINLNCTKINIGKYMA